MLVFQNPRRKLSYSSVSLPTGAFESFNPLISNMKLQILLSRYLYQRRGQFSNLSTEFMLGNHILYSHDLSYWEGVDITKRNLTLITIGA